MTARYKVKKDMFSGLWAVVDVNDGSVIDMWEWRPTAIGVVKKLNKLERIRGRVN